MTGSPQQLSLLSSKGPEEIFVRKGCQWSERKEIQANPTTCNREEEKLRIKTDSIQELKLKEKREGDAHEQACSQTQSTH